MRIYKSGIIYILVLLLPYLAISQEGLSVYSDYLSDNYYLIHPSMAGAGSCSQVRLTARQQWFDHKKAPALQTLSFNTNIEERSGVGIIAFNDRNGYHSQIGGKVSYAHHIKFSRFDYDLNMLSFGISAGLISTTLDETGFGTAFDPVINGGKEQKDKYFNVDIGASYHYMDFYTHFTVKNAVISKRKLYSDVESNNLRKYMLSAGYVFGQFSQSGFYWEPSFMFQFTEKTQEKAFDINLKLYKDFDFASLWGGFSYRVNIDAAEVINKGKSKTQRQQYLTPFIGFNVKNFMIAYTYSHLTGPINFEGGGFHQISIGFNFNCISSRYNCKCPSVNF